MDVYNLETITALAFHLGTYGAEQIRQALLDRIMHGRKEKTAVFVSLFVSLAGGSGTLRAQFRGDIRMTCKRLDVDRDDSLRLEFEFLIRNRAVNTCQSWTFVPELSTADGKHFRYFPRVVINGRNRRRMTDRRNRLTRRFWSEEQPYQTVNVADEEQTLVDYAAAVPYEEWMGGASLKLQEVLASCGTNYKEIPILIMW